MARNKNEKFAEIGVFSNVIEVPYRDIKTADHTLKGKWNSSFFKNDNPIVLELGCGKGEYTTGLAELDPHKNYLGIDIKGARLWVGANHAMQKGWKHVGFIRTHIELIAQFFAPGEVSEIWLTFPDPQMKRLKKRMTSTRFIEAYQRLLKPEGIVHLKSDSNFMYLYTVEMAKANGFEIISNENNIYAQETVAPALRIKTYYEQQWIDRGIKIKYISFIPHHNTLVEPNVSIPEDTYRSFGRGTIDSEQEL